MWSKFSGQKEYGGADGDVGYNLKETLDRMAKANGVRWYGNGKIINNTEGGNDAASAWAAKARTAKNDMEKVGGRKSG